MTGTTVVLVTLAMNQTAFYAPLGEALVRCGFRVVHIAFHQRSVGWLRARGHEVYDAFAAADAAGDGADPAAFGIDDMDAVLTHELAFFALTDRDRLARDFRRFLGGIDRILGEVQAGAARTVVVQELGGFVSVLATFHAARARGIDNIFMEPSFFRGRLFLSRNSLCAPAVPDSESPAASPEVAAYIAQATATRAINVPTKDRRHFRSAADKLTDGYNLRRLVEKLVDKHLLGKREVFCHIGHHVARHVGMFVTNRRLRPLYRPVPTDAPFVYYPLHVPTDFSLTIRSPDYLDQYGLLDRIALALPAGHRLAVKEHPALVGAVDFASIRRLADAHPAFVMLDPTLNNYEVMRAAAAVVTVNSKSGAEALMLGRPVIVLGDAFYRPTRLVHRVGVPGDLPAVLGRVLAGPDSVPDPAAVAAYFQNVWDHSASGELFDPAPDNVERFADSLAVAIGPGGD